MYGWTKIFGRSKEVILEKLEWEKLKLPTCNDNKYIIRRQIKYANTINQCFQFFEILKQTLLWRTKSRHQENFEHTTIKNHSSYSSTTCLNMPPRRRSAEQDKERHHRRLRRTRRRVPIQSRARPLVGRQLRQPRVQVRPRRPEVQALASLLPPEILNLIELWLERTLHQEAQSRRLAHRI